MSVQLATQSRHPEFASEQAAIVRAYQLRDREFATKQATYAKAKANPKAGAQLAQRRDELERGPAPGQLVMGRMVTDTLDVYLGQAKVHDPETRDLVVVNWEAPAMAPFF